MASYAPSNNKEEPMHALCRMVVETNYDKFPGHVINQAKRSILNTLAVAIGDSTVEGIKTMVDFVKDKGGNRRALYLSTVSECLHLRQGLL